MTAGDAWLSRDQFRAILTNSTETARRIRWKVGEKTQTNKRTSTNLWRCQRHSNIQIHIESSSECRKKLNSNNNNNGNIKIWNRELFNIYAYVESFVFFKLQPTSGTRFLCDYIISISFEFIFFSFLLLLLFLISSISLFVFILSFVWHCVCARTLVRSLARSSSTIHWTNYYTKSVFRSVYGPLSLSF